jgi:hypothetical protein
MNHVYETAIEEDEGRFVLVLHTDNGPERFEIHSCAIELYEQVRREIGPWVREAQIARATMPGPVDDGGYDRSDPKHSDWHSTRADIWDARVGK